ncbi:MAG: histidine--tRNA ligase [Candidatus Omnitrophota bacterium]
MQLKALRGTTDLFSPTIEKWGRLERIARDIFKLYGFKEIRTPLLEETVLFQRAIGETTDLVEKQMYSFLDRGERSVTLRPEGTAPVIRAYLEHHFDNNPGLTRLFYIGPMFRAERPQAGRNRQFHQIGGEVIGSSDARVDAETLSLVMHFFEKAGLSGTTLHLNSLGCESDKKKVALFFRQTLEKDKHLLCETCQERFQRNIYRILDCKEPPCRQVVQKLPPILDELCGPCKEHYDLLKRALVQYKIDFSEAPHLVRGLDYYTRTAFEITHPQLGAQDAVCAGGRYDGLVAALGGKPTGSFGFSVGFERLILALEAQKAGAAVEDSLSIFIATIGENTQETAFSLLQDLRRAGISSILDFEGKSLKSQMRLADHLRARWVVLVGEDELKKGEVTVKEMASGQEERISKTRLVEALSERLQEKIS